MDREFKMGKATGRGEEVPAALGRGEGSQVLTVPVLSPFQAECRLQDPQTSHQTPAEL